MALKEFKDDAEDVRRKIDSLQEELDGDCKAVYEDGRWRKPSNFGDLSIHFFLPIKMDEDE